MRPSNDPQIRVPSGLSTPLKAGIGIVFVFLNSGLCVNQSADEGILKILQLFNKACSALEMTAKQALGTCVHCRLTKEVLVLHLTGTVLISISTSSR